MVIGGSSHLWNPNNTCIQSKGRSVPRSISVHSNFPNLSTTTPVHQALLLRDPNLDVPALKRLDKPYEKDVHASKMLLALKILVHNLHRVLRGILDELELRVIEDVVAGDVARGSRLLARVNEGFLSVDHEVIIAEVSIDHDV